MWYHAALTLGNTNKDGKRGMWAFEGSTGAFDFADWDWCRDATMDFIQGMQLPGGVLISPIEITSKPLGVKAIQQMFYDVGPKFAVRRGPAVDDHTRATETIMYERKAFPYPVSLVSPPILLQTRVEKSEVCKNEFGTAYQRKIWNDTIAGVTCEPPYECDEQLLNTSSALMSCSSDNIPPTFFGQTPLKLSGKMQFYECACPAPRLILPFPLVSFVPRARMTTNVHTCTCVRVHTKHATYTPTTHNTHTHDTQVPAEHHGRADPRAQRRARAD